MAPAIGYTVQPGASLVWKIMRSCMPIGIREVAADVSPAYLHRPPTAAKIAELCPRAKIVMVLRNPIEATFSMFSMMHRDRRENCDSFAEAFHRTHERLAAGWEWAWDYQGCFFYSDQVPAIWICFLASNYLFAATRI